MAAIHIMIPDREIIDAGQRIGKLSQCILSVHYDPDVVIFVRRQV